MKKILIYKFYLGNDNKKFDLIDKAKKFNSKSNNFKIIIGPTDDEHEYLMNNNHSYRYLFYKNNFSALKNIYSFWIASKKTNIIFMESYIEFKEEKLYDLFKKCEANKMNCFIFQSCRIVWSGFFISINANNIFYQSYVELSNDKYLDSSLTLTKYLRKNKKIRSFKSYDNDYAYFFNISYLNFYSTDYDVIRINPSYSFSKIKLEKKWSKKIKFFRLTNMRDLIFLRMPFFVQRYLQGIFY